MSYLFWLISFGPDLNKPKARIQIKERIPMTEFFAVFCTRVNRGVNDSRS